MGVDLRLALPGERDERHLPVHGTLPAGLEGTLFRNGPSPRFPAAEAHWFEGDGMVHAITLGRGRASYRNRWVRTARFSAEAAAEHRLGALAGPDNGRANTHVLPHAGHLLALEEAHAPILLCPDTLRTLDGSLGDVGTALPFTAHPKRDPATGELVFFGYSAAGPLSRRVRCGALDAAGRTTWSTSFEAPYCSMVHDFAVTTRHIVVPILPLAGDLDRARRGVGSFFWQPRLGSHLAVLGRGEPGATVRWFEAPACYAFHIVNAWEEGNMIRIDLMRYDAPPFFPDADGLMPAAIPRAYPARWTIDLRRGSGVREEKLADLSGEFPRIDERCAGNAYAHAFLACRGHGSKGLDAIARLDVASGATEICRFNEGDAVCEPIFVPRRADASLNEGWLLSVVTNHATDDSTLVVLDAGAVEQGPIAEIALPHRIPPGFHGSFMPTATNRSL